VPFQIGVDEAVQPFGEKSIAAFGIARRHFFSLTEGHERPFEEARNRVQRSNLMSASATCALSPYAGLATWADPSGVVQ